MNRPLATTAVSGAERTTVALPGGSEGRRLEHLTPVVHELIAWDLVYRSESGGFQLREDVERRLDDLLARQAHATTLVYLGRPCERCGVVTTTRVVDNARVCVTCSTGTVAPLEGPDVPRRNASGPRHHDRHLRRHRKAG